MSNAIQRYQYNDHPFKATISRNGDFSLSGKTVVMAIQIGNGTLHTMQGTITDSAQGKVEFLPTAEMVGTEGVGDYYINVNDGTYEVTYESGSIEFLKGVIV